ncbi:MAG: hypothetical protein SF182_26795 [Deltaproteobacteria bacterium]|nr:hypothetical protein [Deltaproteobacteria bacterium]
MNPDRAIGVILALSIALVLGLGGWLLWRGRHAPVPALPTASPTGSPTATASPTATGAIPDAARGYRLAGTVVGDVTYAIIEKPRGGNELLRPGQVLRGVGQVVAIGEDRIAFEGDDGRFELMLSAAPTVTPTRVRLTPSPSPAPPASPARSTSESSP